MRRSNINIPSEGYEYIVGRNVVLESLKAGRTFKNIYLEASLEGQRPSLTDTYSKDTRINAIITRAKTANVSISYVARQEILNIEDGIAQKSEGVIGIVKDRKEYTVEEILALCKTKNKEPFIIVVNNILYEENLGAILRTCAAGGVDAVIIPKRDKRELTATVVRISMGGANMFH